MLRSRYVGLILVGLSAIQTGCAHLSNSEAGALGGGAIGTAAGLAIGAATGNPKTGAIVGGLAGAGVGGLAGQSADNEEARREYNQYVAANAQPATPPLGLTDVISLTQTGVGDDVIINQMRSTGSTYQLSPGDIQYLKTSGVSDPVLNAMISARVQPVAPPRPRTVIVREPSPVILYERPWPHHYGYCGPPPRCGPSVRIHGHFGH